MDILQFTVELEPTGETYSRVVHASTRWCTAGLLVVHPQVELSARGQDLLRRIAPAVRTREERSNWPGTALLESTAEVLTFDLTPEVVDALASGAHGLFDWQQPDLPEDLCLMRGVDDPWLVSIAHEGDAFVRVTGDELAELRRVLPEFVATLAPEDTAET